MRRIVAVVAVVASCSVFNPSTARWPLRGDFVCTANTTAQVREVVAEDGIGRKLKVRELEPGQEKCFRWPFIHEDGRVGLVVQRDTVWGAWFKPWKGVPGA